METLGGFDMETTHHVLMFCFADGDIIRKISAVADRLSGGMLSNRVSSVKNGWTATAWAILTNSALQIPSANSLAHYHSSSGMSTHFRNRASK